MMYCFSLMNLMNKDMDKKEEATNWLPLSIIFYQIN